MLGYFSMFDLEVEERNRKGVVLLSKFLYPGVWRLHGCAYVYIYKGGVRVKERGKEKKVLHSKQSFCPLIMLLIISLKIFELSAIY